MRFFLSCLFIVLYLIRPFEFIPSLYNTPILLVCGVAGVLSVLFALINAQAKWLESDIFMVGFLLAILFSHISHLYLEGVLSSFEKFLPVFMGYFLISHSLSSKSQIIFFYYLIVACCCFIAIEGCAEYYKGISYFGVEPLMQNSSVEGERLIETRIKWLGPFADPNDLALLFVIPIPFLIARFKQSKIFSLAAGGLLSLGIFYTNSRGGMLALIVAILSYFALRYRNKTGLLLGGLLGVCLLLLGPSRMASMSAGEDSAYGRLESWYAGYQMFKTSPFFGVGMGMYTDYHELTAHNSFVLVMAELGLFGLFCFTGLFYVSLAKIKLLGWGELRKSLIIEDVALLSSLAASLLAVMTAMFFLSRSYILIPYMLVGLIIKLCGLLAPVRAQALPNNKTLKETMLITIIGIVFINVFIKVLL